MDTHLFETGMSYRVATDAVIFKDDERRGREAARWGLEKARPKTGSKHGTSKSEERIDLQSL